MTSLAEQQGQDDSAEAFFEGRSTRCRSLGTVQINEPMGAIVTLGIHVPGWKKAMPGQFALLQAEDSKCFLGRALSVSDQSGEVVSFMVAPVGPGTRELCSLGVGKAVWVLGPLGNGFDLGALTSGGGRVLLVGGGAGIAPFPLLVSELARLAAERRGAVDRESTSIVLVLAGFRNSEQARACEPLAEAVGRAAEGGVACRYEAALEDSPDEDAVLVTDLLGRHLKSGDRVAVCGPEAMARAVWEICSSVPDTRAWFSLETNMACGVGSCHGCVVPLTDGSYARVCREGPVFSGEEVFGG